MPSDDRPPYGFLACFSLKLLLSFRKIHFILKITLHSDLLCIFVCFGFCNVATILSGEEQLRR